MAQKWYIQFPDRTVGPITARKLQKLALDGELTSNQMVSLDNEQWFRASKVLGLFSEGPDRGRRGGDAPAPDPVGGDDITFNLARDVAAPRGLNVGSSPVDDAASKAALNGAEKSTEADPSPVGAERPDETSTLVLTTAGKTAGGLPRSLQAARSFSRRALATVPLWMISFRVLPRYGDRDDPWPRPG